MKKKYLLLIILFTFGIILLFNSNSYAADLDEIINYIVIVEPRMNDGTLDITYEITWKVLDSATEGPLTWVQIGTPNSYFDNPTALTNNIRSISKYNGAYVKIYFDRAYTAGQELTFRYKIHQSYMYKISWGNCKYSFTPAWFTDAKVDNLTVMWNKDEVKSSNAKTKEDNYLVWNKTNMAKGEKLKVNVKYDKDSFGYLNENTQRKSGNSFNTIFIIMIAIIIIYIIIMIISGGGYYGHGGFYGGYYGGYYRSCVSSCACACAHSSCASSCACACAGSGRAGCSKKDFYGTKISEEKLKKVFNENKDSKKNKDK